MSVERWNVVYKCEKSFSLRKEILTHTAICINLDDILSEIRYSQEDKYYKTPFIWGAHSNQIHRNRNRFPGVGAWQAISILQDEKDSTYEWWWRLENNVNAFDTAKPSKWFP
jgi:hypothetical protein